MDVATRNNVTRVGDPSGPTLVLAHGFGCDQQLWHRVASRLRDRFDLVLFDHVGSGNAEPAAWDPDKYASLNGYADDVVELVEALDLRDVVFVGHSVAAMIGALAVSAAPARFAKLVMVTPSPRYIDDDGYRGGFTHADIAELLDSLESNYLGWSQAMAPTIMGNPERPELAEDLATTFCRTDPAAAKVFARATFLADNRADLAGVSVPTLIVDCRQDVIAPPEVGAYVRDHIPGAQLITLDATGHCPHVSAPDATAEVVAAFAGR
ncbi:alpha/beta fold hydrolase [Mycolicibacterium sphagni]|jgi:sigma-B regulation protein RsbQ|uniref:Alpha/beta hydrolase n=1 Tax=Mycolicibacterium sphagni TaxID=1786 RepID=A0A255DIK1_9MYCO|nr:alpha/beta hydrolase [Mycolicibacterium sphagni]MCV7177382.1 alpha/beta hydrolase [Mycolicibacterium sphagni]OYN77065.1 alpha/beta hydrolase [Mycolicibacterium sphagni]